MPGTLLLDDWRSSVEDQLHQAADQAIATARAAQQATIAPVQQAAQVLPQVQAPDPNQVGAALHGYVDQLGQQAQQAAPAVIQLGQDAQQAGAQVLGGAQQAATTALGGAQDAQTQVGDALHQHVNNLLSIGGGAPPVTAINQPPTLGGPQGAAPSNQPVVTTLGGSSQPTAGDVSGGPPSADTATSGTPVVGVPSWLTDLIRKNAPPELAGDPDFIRTVAAGAKAESGWDPNAVQKGGGGRGLFQFDLGGMGKPYANNESVLLGQEGAQLQASQIVPLYAKAYQNAPANLTGAEKASWVAAQAERPYDYQNPQASARRNYASAYAEIGGPPTVATTPPVTTAQARAADLGYRDISQFGDSQLTSDEAYAACGPAAAVRFAEKFGRNPTLREATDLAKQVGWTSGGGMAGISSEQKLMSNLGIDTKIVGRDWAAYAQEAQTGNPVTISTPGHYYFADGYNPESGAFHVGRSGLDLKGGSEWMTPSQMENLMGQAQGALFANNPTVPNRGNTTSSNAAAPDAINAPTAPAAKAPIVMGGMQDANGQPTARGYSGPTLIQTAQDAAGEALGDVGSAVGGAASALGGAAQGAVQGAQQAAAQVAPVLGGAASATGSTVRSVADDLGNAAQGAVNQVQDLNRQTPGTSVVNAAAPVLGGAASEVGSNVRNVADQAGQVLGGASDTAQNLVLRQGRTPAEQTAFEEGQRQALGQIVQQGQQPAGPMNAGDVARNAWDLVVNSNPGLPGVSLQDYQHASTVKNDWIQQNNPVYNLPGGRPGEGQTTPASVLGDLTTSIAQQITDPLSMTQFGLLGNVGGGAVGGAVGGRVAAGVAERLGPAAADFLGRVTDKLVSGGITGGVQNALYAAEQSGATPQTVGMAALQGMGFGAALEGGVTAAAPLVRTIGRAIIDRAPELRTATAQFATSETGALGRPEDVRAEAARQAGEQTAPDEPVRSLPAGGAAANPYDLPRSAPEPTAAPLSETEVLSHLEQLDQLSTQNDARIADLQNQVAAGTAAPEARAQLTRLQADQVQIDAAHTSIWEHAGSGGDVYARSAPEPLPSPGAVDAGAAQAARGPAPAPAAATGGRGEARTSLPGSPGAPEPAARPEPAAAELTGFRAPAAGETPAGAAGREPPYTPPAQNLSDVHSNPHLLNEARPGETPMTTDELAAHRDTLAQQYQANQDRLAAIDEQLRNPNAKPERPPWGAGWTNDQLVNIARAHGESAYAPLWWERAGLDVGSGEVRENVGEGGFRNPNAGRDRTPAELRAERNQIAQEQRDLQAAGDQHATAPDNARFVRRTQTTADLPFERGADGVHGPHAVEQPNDTPGAVAADMVTKNGTKDYGNPLQEGPGQVIGRKGEVTGRGISDAEAANVGEPSAQTKHLMPNLDAMLKGEMPEVRAQIQKAAEDNPELMAAYQQGRISRDSVMTDLATKVGMSKEDWLKTPVGKGFSTPELAALQAAAIDAQEQSRKLAGDIVAKGGVDVLTPEEVAHSLSTLVDNSRLLAVARGGRASAGRSLNILKQKLDATMAQGINASNERIAALRVKSQAQAAVKRASQQLEQAKALDDEKRTVTARAQASGAPKNIVDQIAEAYDQLDRYQAMTLHEKADDFNALKKARDEAAAKRQAAVREPPQELLSALKAELAAERTNFAKRKDTWETMAFWDSKANENVATKRNAFRGGRYIEQYRKAAELAAKRADQEASRAWDLESRRQGVQRDKASALLEAVGGQKPTRELLDNYVQAINSDDPMVAAKFIKGLQDPGWWGKSQILRIAGLLSSTTTHLVNMVGNVTQVPLTLAEHALVVPIDWARSSLTGGERQAYMAELGPMAGSWGHGTLAALPDAIKILQTGISPEEATRVASGKVGRPGFASGNNVADAAVEMPLRLLSAEDQLFRGGAFAMQSQRVATNYATKEGFRGKALEGRVSNIIANLESYPDLYTQASKATDRMLFQERRTMPLADRLPAKGVPGAITQGTIGQVLPFIKTPGNITAQGFGLSPFGAAGVAEAIANRRNLRPEQLGQQTLLTEQRAARALIGTGIMGAGMALGAGVFTGGKSALTGAYDQSEASTYPQGYREWSLAATDPVSGNTYYIPFQNFGAAGAPLAMAAILTDAGRRGKQVIDGDEAVKASTAIGQYILDNTFLQGLSDTVNVLHDPTRYAPQFVQGLVSSYGPYSAMARQVQRAMGVASRNPHDGFMGLVDAMEANYPGLSGNVPEATSPLGDPKTQGISGAATFALPIRADISRDEPTLAALRSADVQIPAAPKAISVGNGWSIQLSEAEQDQLKRARGVLIREEVANVLSSPKYQAAVRDHDVSTMNLYLRQAVSNAAQNSNVDFQRSMTKEQLQARAERKAAPEPYILAGAAD